MFRSVHVKVNLTWGRPRRLLSLLARTSDDRDGDGDNRWQLRLRLGRRLHLRLLFRRRGWRYVILVFRARSDVLEKCALFLFLWDRNRGRPVLLLSSAADEQIGAVLRCGNYRRFRCITRRPFHRQWGSLLGSILFRSRLRVRIRDRIRRRKIVNIVSESTGIRSVFFEGRGNVSRGRTRDGSISGRDFLR